MLWTEKYRPKRIQELIGQESFKLDAENWIELNDMPNILLYGQAGLGKTASAGILANEILKTGIDSNYFELNASDDRGIDTIRNTIKDIAQQKAIGKVPFKLILLDEMDGMTSDAQRALKRIMERYADNVRSIITANDRNKIIYPLQSRCANYFFSRIDDGAIFTLCENILTLENKEIPSDLSNFISNYNGDVRRIITEMQAAISSGTSLKVQVNKNLERYDNVLRKIVEGNYHDAIEQLHKAIFAGETVRDICFGLHEVVIKSEINSALKLKYLIAIGEAEWRGTSTTPRILVSWMVSHMK